MIVNIIEENITRKKKGYTWKEKIPPQISHVTCLLWMRHGNYLNS